MFEGIKKSKSLLSVHLSGNIKNEIIKRVLNWSKPTSIKGLDHKEKSGLNLRLINKTISNKGFPIVGRMIDKKLQTRLDIQRRQSMMLELYKMSQKK